MPQTQNSLLPKLFVVGSSFSYAEYLLEQNDVAHFDLTRDPEKADIAMFTGGEDVNPGTYGEPVGSRTHFSGRDKEEVKLFNFFRSEDIPMIGICRGHQLFAGLSGGRLIQDVTGHAGGRHLVNFEGYNKILPFPSAHHQMVDPTRMQPDWIVLGISDSLLSKRYLDGNDKEINGVDTELECVHYVKSNALGIQGHPEWMDSNSESVAFWRELIRERLL